MKKSIIIIFSLLLVGTGCSDQSDVVDQQQKQIEELTKKVEELSDESNQNLIESEEKTPSEEYENPKVEITKNTNPITERIVERVTVKEAPNIMESSTKENTTLSTDSFEKEMNESLSISNVQAIPTVNDIKFRWQTNKPSTGYITLWPVSTENGIYEVQSLQFKNSHELQTNLRLISNKEYTYTVTASDSEGNVATSEERKITTPVDKMAPQFSFSPLYQKGGYVFVKLQSNEYTNVYYSFNSSYNTKFNDVKNPTISSNFITLDYPYFSKIVKFELGTFLPHITEVYIKMLAVDDDLNYSETKWGKYNVGQDIPIQ